MMVANKI